MVRALRRPALDMTIHFHPGLTTRVVERPGLWLEDESLAALVGDLRKVAAAVLPAGELRYGVFSGERAALERVVVTLLSDAASGAPVAFNALALLPVDYGGERIEVVHLGLVMVDPAARGRGLSAALYGLTTLMLFLRGGLRGFWISNVTQVPAVVGMVCETFSDVWPSPLPQARGDFAHKLLGRRILRFHRGAFGVGPQAEYDDVGQIVRAAYDGGSDDLKKTFAQAPKHREEIFNRFCETRLDYARGDDFLQIGRMDLAAARRFAAAHVAPGSAPALLAAGAFLLLQAALLPALYWLDPRARFGALRARAGRGAKGAKAMETKS